MSDSISFRSPAIRQIAALPYRIDAHGRADVMLITSRETRRWVLPKGNLIKGLDWHQAAAQEAFEEAGVTGIACPTAIGEYRYAKRRRNGTTRDVSVAVFPLAFIEQAAEWPEEDERETRWFTLREAAAAIEEPDLAQLIAHFRAPPPPPGLAGRVIPAMQAEARKRVPMLEWFHALLPRQGRFFDLFEAHAATLVAGADALALLLRGGPDAARLHELTARLVQLEGHSDELYEVGLKSAFKQANGETMGFFVQRELFGALERTVDRFEEAARSEIIADEAMGAGANDFMTKPFSPDELVNRVEQVLETIRSAGERSRWRS